jgi:dihydroorotate dehydrogenase electron transfer subunit
MTGREHRGTIFVEDAEVRAHQEFPGRQYVIRLHAPRCAAAAVPCGFAHLSCDADLPMRRPLSIMLADAAAGTNDILYKAIGSGWNG